MPGANSRAADQSIDSGQPPPNAAADTSATVQITKAPVTLESASLDKTYDGHYSGVELFDYPHCDRIAEAYDMPFFHASHTAELDKTLDEFLACKEACLMVCDVDWTDNSK